MVYVPKTDRRGAQWANVEVCLWEAPADMQSEISLKPAYTLSFGEAQVASLSYFFQQTLCIPDASLLGLVIELGALRDSKCEDFDRILGLYKYLRTMNLTMSDVHLLQ